MDLDRELKERFQLDAFRPWQKEAIEAVLGAPGRVLVVAPTGGGKSLTYQLPAAVLDGMTLVISPLVALMEDQVRSLRGRGVPATFLASTLDMQERREREQMVARGEVKLLYAAPERLASDAFQHLLASANIELVAIDEAHCIAQWGHDFRPDYLRIGALLERLRPRRILACTATATPLVRKEIVQQLGLDRAAYKEVLRGFARPNLHLAARWVDGPKEARASVIEALKEALGDDTRRPRGGAIIYAATRKAAEQGGEMLAREGWRTGVYHAGLSADERTKTSHKFAMRKIDVVVATNAFGMGIDRPDIRVVVHLQPPSSIEGYYQEVGRAGRDGDEAHGLLLCSGTDVALRRRMVESSSDGGPAPVEQAARAWALFRELLLYLDARTCRHDFVLRYFGDEQETLGGCGHCDVCAALEEAPASSAATALGDEETTLAVKKALSGVARAQRRAGMIAISEMLLGLDSERTRKFGFRGLTTFGLFADKPQAWVMALLRALLAAGWIDLTPSEHPVPYVTDAGRDVMTGRAAARLVLPEIRTSARRSSKTKKARVELPALAAKDMAVFEKLRAHRAEIARSRGVPAYVVAHDRTLAELATHRPRTAEELLTIRGFGPARVSEYGAGFLDVLSAAP